VFFVILNLVNPDSIMIMYHLELTPNSHEKILINFAAKGYFEVYGTQVWFSRCLGGPSLPERKTQRGVTLFY
jgi:hypothetical protein